MPARDAIERGRAQVFEAHARPCLYTPPGLDPIVTRAKLHEKFDALGEVKGTSYDYAEKQEPRPIVLVFQDTIYPPLKRNAMIMFAVDRGYRVDNIKPRHGAYVDAVVTRLQPSDLVGLPYPGDVDHPLSLWS